MGNRLSGTIPTHLGGIASLWFLYIHDNKVTGSLPTEIGSLTNLMYFYANNNLLESSLPSQLGLMTTLQQLDLGNNSLSGSLTSSLGSMKGLTYLQLAGNNALTGSIPMELCSLKKMGAQRTGLACYPACLDAVITADPFCLVCSSTPPVQTRIDFTLTGISTSDAARLAGSLKQAMATALGLPVRFVALSLMGARRLRASSSSSSSSSMKQQQQHSPNSHRALATASQGFFTVSLPAAIQYTFPDSASLEGNLAKNFAALTGISITVSVSFESPTPNAAPTSSALSTGAIVGIAVGSLGLIACLVASVYLCRHQVGELLLGKEFHDFEEYQRSTSAKVYIAGDEAVSGTGDSLTNILLSRITMRFSNRVSASAMTSLAEVSSHRRSVLQRSSGDSAIRRNIDWNKLEMLETIDEGAYGLIIRARWMGRNKSVGMSVAIKVVKLGTHLGGQTAAMIALDEEAEILEAATADQLNDNVVKLVGTAIGTCPAKWKERLAGKQVVGEDGLMIGLVLRFEEGGNLRKLLHGKDAVALRLTDRVRIIQQIANGLYHLHNNNPENIVHGDLKPENILLSSVDISTMVVRLADFGMSKLTADKGSARSATAIHGGHAGGTWMYQAPETIQNKMPNSRTSDMYSFGTLIWEVVSGCDPWPECRREGPNKCPEDCEDEGHFNLQTRINKINQDGENGSLDFSKLPKDTPPEIVQLIKRCLSYTYGKDTWRASTKSRPQIGEALNVINSAYEAMTSGHHDIFLSYAWGKVAWRQPLAMEIVKELRERGYSTWFDVYNMRTDLEASMRAGISTSKCVVVLLSPDYAISKNCAFELDVALRSGKPIITCLVEPGGDIGEGQWWTAWEHPWTREKAMGKDKVADWMDVFHRNLKLDTQLASFFGQAAEVKNWDQASAADCSLLHHSTAMPRLLNALIYFNIHPSSDSFLSQKQSFRNLPSLMGWQYSAASLANMGSSRKMSIGNFATSIMGMSKADLDGDEKKLEANKQRIAKLLADHEGKLERAAISAKRNIVVARELDVPTSNEASASIGLGSPLSP